VALAAAIGTAGWVSVAGRHSNPVTRPLFVKSYARPAGIPFPNDNEYSAAREALGRSLFFDPALSKSGVISCASCHNPALSWSDGLPRAVGHGKTVSARRTPTLLNVAWSELTFWDGRAASLEEQALIPIQAAGEMNQKLDSMIANLRAAPRYEKLFARAYPGEPISELTAAKAIATFERGIISGTAPFDLWAAGDNRAMPAAAQRGFIVFNTKGHCSACHDSWRFSDDSFHDIGVPGNDPGRGAILPAIEVMQHAFKTPTLRDVARRAPYMHDGSVATLEQVIELYDRGGDAKRSSLSPEIKPLHLTPQEKQDLIAFLRSLTTLGTETEIATRPISSRAARIIG
jgi:cytochrome c peroxidase